MSIRRPAFRLWLLSWLALSYGGAEAQDTVHFSVNNGGTVGTLSVADEDIVSFDGANFTRLFDGSDVGVAALRLGAFDVISTTEILISFTTAGSVPGISGTVDAADIVLFTATQLGETTAGAFSLYFDGSDVDLTGASEKIDGLVRLEDGTLLISGTGWTIVGGFAGGDEDVFAFAPSSTGSTTSGTWSHYFDGSDLKLGESGEDVDALALDEFGNLYLSTTGTFVTPQLSGADEDVFVFQPTTLGSRTTGTLVSPVFLDGSTVGLGSRGISGFDISSGPTNPPPVADADFYSVVEDNTLNVPVGTGVLSNDSDPEGEMLTATLVSNASNGNVILGSDGAFMYTPNADFSGTDSFVYAATDTSNGTATATATMTVTNQNDAPVAADQTVSTTEDTSVAITLSATDVDGDPLSYAVVSNPSNGFWTGTEPNLTYLPDPGFVGTDSFTFQANDGTVDSNTATIFVAVSAPPATPSAKLLFCPINTVTLGSISVANEDIVGFDGTDYFKYFDGSDVGLSSLAVDGFHVISATEILFTFAAAGAVPGISGTVDDSDICLFTATELGDTTTGSWELYFDGSDVELALNSEDIDALTLRDDGTLLVSLLGSFAVSGASGGDEDILAFSPTSLGSTTAGTWTMYFDGSDVGLGASSENVDGLALDADGAIVLSVRGSFSVPGLTGNNEDIFIFQPSALGTSTAGTFSSPLFFDGSNEGFFSDVAAFALPIASALNDSPVAIPQSPSTDEDVPLLITLTANDTESDPLTFSVISGPSNGSLTGTEPNFTYTPNLNFNGADSFTFVANDGNTDSGPATVSITINPINDAPVAADQPVSTPEDTAVAVTISATDVDGDSLTYTVNDPTNGALTGTAPNLTYTPNLNFNGADSFTFFVNDGNLDSDLATVSIDVVLENDPPVAIPQSPSTDEDVPLLITLTANDTESDPLTFSVISGPSNGSLTGTEPNFTYTPNLNFNGADSFTFVANDGNTDSGPATVSITINPINDAPVAADQPVSTPEDTAVAITLGATDVDGDSLTYTVNDPANGALTGTAPNLTYTPNLNFNGADSFTFFVNDGNLDSDLATVSIDVVLENDPPVAIPQSPSTDEDVPLLITLTANDTESDPLTFSVISGPSNGSLTGTEPNFTYTPNLNFNGADSFTFVANDGNTDSGPATVSITINSINDAPVAADQPVSTPEDTAVAITLGATDVDGDSLTYTVNDPANGALTGTAPNLTYTPNLDFNGAESFTFFVNDGNLDSNLATVSINVVLENDPPVAIPQSPSTDEDVPLLITLTATDTESDPLTFSVISGPSNGSLTGTEPNFTYTPNLNFNGADSFTFVANDGNTDSGPTTVSITINPINDAPVAADQPVSTPEDTAVAITLGATDVDGDSLTYTVNDPANGALTGTAPNLTYTPNLNFNGADSFTFFVNDGNLDSDLATVSINVQPINDDPDGVNDDTFAVNEDSTGNALDVLANDTDADNDTLFVDSVGALSAGGSVVNNGIDLSYEPATDFQGIETFSYTVGDGNGGFDTANVSVTVNNLNDNPDAVEDLAFSVNKDSGATSLDVLANDTDIDPGDQANLIITGVGATSAGGTATNGGGSSVSYQPALGYVGLETFTYTIGDGNGGTDTATVSVNVESLGPVIALDEDFSSTDLSAWIIVDEGNWAGPSTWSVTSGQLRQNSNIRTAPVGATDYSRFGTYVRYLGGSAWTDYRISLNMRSGDDDVMSVMFRIQDADNFYRFEWDRQRPHRRLVKRVGGQFFLIEERSGAYLANQNYTIEITVEGTAINVSIDGAPDFSQTDGDLTFGTMALHTWGNQPTYFDNVLVEDLTGGASNTPPTANDDIATVSENSSNNSIDVLFNDTDADFGDTLTLTSVTPPSAGGTATTDGTIVTYSPAAAYVGVETFSYTIQDALGATDTAMATITVSDVNDPPTVVDDNFTVNEDSVGNGFDVLANDSDIESDPLTISSVTQGSDGGTVTTNGAFVSYAPPADFADIETFTYTANDGNGGTAVATVRVNVANLNDPPTAIADSLAVLEDTIDAVVDVVLNDLDPDFGDTLSVDSVGTPSAGGTVVNAGPFVEYSPLTDFNGVETFTYDVRDASGELGTGTVTITVVGVDDPPKAVDDDVSVLEDSANNVLTILDNDSDPDPGDTYSITAVGQGSDGGTVTNHGTHVTYSPAADFFGVETFAYVLVDSTGLTNGAIVSVTIGDLNDPPVSVDDIFSVDMDSGTNALPVLANDVDPNPGDTLTITGVSATSNGGIATINGATISYTPPTGYLGPDGFTYTVVDGSGLPGIASVTVNVIDRTQPNTYLQGAGPEYFLVIEAENFVDMPPATSGEDFVFVAAPPGFVDSGAMLVGANPSGPVRWNFGFAGVAPEMRYNIEVDQPGIYNVWVRGNAISVVSNSVHVGLDGADHPTARNIEVPVDSDAFRWSNPGKTIEILTTGNHILNVWARERQFPIDRIVLTLDTTFVPSGNGPPESPQTGNSPPEGTNDSFVVAEETTTLLNVVDNDLDPDVSDSITLTSIATPDMGGTAILSGNSVSYSPAADFAGVETFYYVIEDTSGALGSGTVSVTVTDVNDPPAGVDDTFTVPEFSTSNLLDVLANDLDPDVPSGDVLTVTAITPPSGGGTAFVNSPFVDYAPAEGFTGIETFTYTFEDSFGFSSSAMATVTVAGVDPITATLSETFDDGNFFGWSIVDDGNISAPSAWAVTTGGVLEQSSGIGSPISGIADFGTMLLYDPGESWTDYTFQVTVTSEDDDNIGVIFRARSPDDYYRFDLSKQRPFRRLIKNVAGAFTLIADDDIAYTPGQPIVLQVVVQGNQIETRVNGTLVFSVTDDSLASGTIGFYTFGNSRTLFDDVTVTPFAPTLRIEDATVTEGDASPVSAEVVVNLSPASTSVVTVDYDTAPGTASANIDFTTTSGMLTFLPGERQKTIDIVVLPDTATEGTETFDVVLSNEVGAAVAQATGIATISEDDGELPGLTVRPPNPDCRLPDPPTQVTGVTLTNPYPNLVVPSEAVSMYHRPGDDSRWYLLRRIGLIVAFDNDPNVSTTSTVLDLRSRMERSPPGEWGLKSLAFHPDFDNNGEVFVSYAGGAAGEPLVGIVSRFFSPDGGLTIDINSEEILIQESSENRTHMSTRMYFGPEQNLANPLYYLYIGVGDWGSGANGHTTDNIFGSFLRLDVDAGVPYGIPPDNVFAGGGGAPEIWAWGFRNPWGWSFDSFTDELWVGDVGGELFEEINVAQAGKYHGWSKFEGTFCKEIPICPDSSDYVFPVMSFSRTEMRSIAGGFVYRGTAIPELFGVYVYGDWLFQQVFSLPTVNGVLTPTPLATVGKSVYSFAEDLTQELYVVANREILKLEPQTPPSSDLFPQLLSDLACVDPLDPSQPVGMIPYSVNVPFWSEGADKDRWLALPDGATITIEANGDWTFPIGTLILKHFRLGGTLIETRVFTRHDDGSWAGYTYEWNPLETEAVLVPGAKSKIVQGQTWSFPSRLQCLGCHTPEAGFVLGLGTLQTNGPMNYPSTGLTANQLHTFENIGLFSAPLPASPADLPSLPSPNDVTKSLETRAMAYLEANCAHCHNPDHPLDSTFDARFETPLANTNVCGATPLVDDLGLPNALLITPGDPTQSILSRRVRALNSDSMPIGNNLTDEQAADLIDTWISSLNACPGP